MRACCRILLFSRYLVNALAIRQIALIQPGLTELAGDSSPCDAWLYVMGRTAISSGTVTDEQHS
jgi:hypothetical protein